MSTYKATLRVMADEAERLVTALEESFDLAPGGVLAFEDPDAKTWTIEAIYTDAPDKEALAALARDAGLALRMLSIEALPEIDWVRKSLADLPPIRAGRFFVAGGHDMDKAPGGGTTLQIEAAQAFGTGSHPTTRGCLLALDALAKKGLFARPLDLGTGSGILAFAMAKLWRVPVLATDIDPISVATAREFAHVNGVRNIVRFLTADGFHDPRIRARAPFDLIVANILAGPLVKLAGPVARHLMPGGILVLSGLLAEQEVFVRAAYRARGLHLLSRRVIDGWTTLILTGRRRCRIGPRALH